MLTLDQQTFKQRLLQLDSASIADALDSLQFESGLIGIQARVLGHKIAGPAFTVKYLPFKAEINTFHNAGNYIDQVPAQHVVLVDNQGRQDCTSWGDILTTKAQLSQIAGTVVYGAVRDIQNIRQQAYPVFSSHIFMVSGKNRAKVSAIQEAVQIGNVEVFPGDWLFGDDNGVVAIPQAALPQVIERAEATQQTESKIITAIQAGGTLVDAREQYGYQRPWEHCP